MVAEVIGYVSVTLIETATGYWFVDKVKMKFKVTSNITNASALLLSIIFDRLGGSTEVGNRVGLERQNIHNFEVNGYVPLKQVYSIAKDLKLKVWHLSYSKLMEVHGNDTPHMPALVKELKFLTNDDKDKILKVYYSTITLRNKHVNR